MNKGWSVEEHGGTNVEQKEYECKPVQNIPEAAKTNPTRVRSASCDGADAIERAASTKGASSPIVAFRQSRRSVLIFDGRGEFSAFSSSENEAVLLYPSKASAILLDL